MPISYKSGKAIAVLIMLESQSLFKLPISCPVYLEGLLTSSKILLIFPNISRFETIILPLSQFIFSYKICLIMAQFFRRNINLKVLPLLKIYLPLTMQDRAGNIC